MSFMTNKELKEALRQGFKRTPLKNTPAKLEDLNVHLKTGEELAMDIISKGCYCIDKSLDNTKNHLYIFHNQRLDNIEMLEYTYSDLKKLGKIDKKTACYPLHRISDSKQWLFYYDASTESLLYNEYTAFTMGIPERQSWLYDKKYGIIHEHDYKIELDPLIKTLVENVVGENAEWFLKKEAVRFAELCKLKSFDVIITHGRDIGKDVLINLITRLYVPHNRSSDEYFGEIENGSKKVFGTNIHNSTVSLKLVESGMTKQQFDLIKSLQSKAGTQVPIKNRSPKMVNAYCLYAYVLKNHTVGNKDIYFSDEASLRNSMFFSFNQEANFLTDLVGEEGIEKLANPSIELISNFRQYMLALYDSLSEEEIATVKSCEKFVAQSAYDPSKFIFTNKAIPAKELPQKYISCIENGDTKGLMELMEFGVIDLLEKGNTKERNMASKLGEMLYVYKSKQDGDNLKESPFRVMHHKVVASALGVESVWKYYQYFTSYQDCGKLKTS